MSELQLGSQVLHTRALNKIQSPSKSSADPQLGTFVGKSIWIADAWSECFCRKVFSSSRSLAGIPLEDSSAMTAAGFRRMHCSEHNFSLFGCMSPLSQFCSAAGRHDPCLHFGLPTPPCSSSCRCMNAGIMIMLRTYDFSSTLIEQMAALGMLFKNSKR